jgi:type II secretory pathway predicted ATPase ExeA
MYQAFFGLSDKPFSETPDPRFFFLSVRHREGLAHLEYNILDGKGFSVLVGEVGTGKTTLCRTLMDRLDPKKVTVAHIIHTNLDFSEFLQEVVEELGISPPGRQKWDLLKALNLYLIEAHGQNRKVVLIVDEAQNLKPSVLEGIRMLSNLETPREKLIQIIFMGQPEFLKHIQRSDMVQLRQRIAGSFFLGPLTRKETQGYILSRLNRVQAKPALRFTSEALDLIYQYSKGIPRLINFLCDFSLIHAYVAEVWTVDRRLVQSAYQEIMGRRLIEDYLVKKENRFLKGLPEIRRGEGQGPEPAWKRLRVQETLSVEIDSDEGTTREGDKFLFPGSKSWPKKTAVTLGLALTVLVLISLALAFRFGNPESWRSMAASPPYQIQIPLSEPEKETPDDPHPSGKGVRNLIYEPKESKFNQPGAPR